MISWKTRPAHRLAGARKRDAHYSSRRAPRSSTIFNGPSKLARNLFPRAGVQQSSTARVERGLPRRAFREQEDADAGPPTIMTILPSLLVPPIREGGLIGLPLRASTEHSLIVRGLEHID